MSPTSGRIGPFVHLCALVRLADALLQPVVPIAMKGTAFVLCAVLGFLALTHLPFTGAAVAAVLAYGVALADREMTPGRAVAVMAACVVAGISAWAWDGPPIPGWMSERGMIDVGLHNMVSGGMMTVPGFLVHLVLEVKERIRRRHGRTLSIACVAGASALSSAAFLALWNGHGGFPELHPSLSGLFCIFLWSLLSAASWAALSGCVFAFDALGRRYRAHLRECAGIS